jgi:hypothetical protein
MSTEVGEVQTKAREIVIKSQVSRCTHKQKAGSHPGFLFVTKQIKP